MSLMPSPFDAINLGLNHLLNDISFRSPDQMWNHVLQEAERIAVTILELSRSHGNPGMLQDANKFIDKWEGHYRSWMASIDQKLKNSAHVEKEEVLLKQKELAEAVSAIIQNATNHYKRKWEDNAYPTKKTRIRSRFAGLKYIY